MEKKIAHENGFLEKESETLLELSTNISAEPILRHYAYGEAPHFRYLVNCFFDINGIETFTHTFLIQLNACDVRQCCVAFYIIATSFRSWSSAE